MSKVTTIEEWLEERSIGKPVGERYSFDEVSELIRLYKAEASLTPSNEKYWRERCEAAEAIISEIEQGIFIGQMYGYDKWSQLKSTPIPLTPCGELEKEVERLKGLLHGQAYSVWKGCSSDLRFEEWYKLYQNNL